MAAQKGRPWCKQAGMYINIKPDNRNVDPQCESCTNLVYVGCPDFRGNIKFALRRTEDYVRWMRGEPIADDSPLFDDFKKPKPLCAPAPDCPNCDIKVDCGGQELRNLSSNQTMTKETE